MNSNAANDVARIYGIRLSRLERALVEKSKVYRRKVGEADAVKETLRKNVIERGRIIGKANQCGSVVPCYQLRELSAALRVADNEIARTSARLDHLLAEQQQSKQAVETTRTEYLSMQHKQEWLQQRRAPCLRSSRQPSD